MSETIRKLNSDDLSNIIDYLRKHCKEALISKDKDKILIKMECIDKEMYINILEYIRLIQNEKKNIRKEKKNEKNFTEGDSKVEKEANDTLDAKVNENGNNSNIDSNNNTTKNDVSSMSNDINEIINEENDNNINTNKHSNNTDKSSIVNKLSKLGDN